MALMSIVQFLGNLTVLAVESIGNYIDIHYTLWLTWLFTPLLVIMLLPVIILLLLFGTSLLLYIYKLHRHRLLDAYDRDLWETGRKMACAIWDAHGWLWHGYEIYGLENIPEEGGALLVYYHGAIPIDFYYVCSHCLLYKGRLISAVGDKFLFKVPGWSSLLEAFGVIPGTIQSCAAILKAGNLLAIAPGGVYEAQMGDNNYQLLWKQRAGFAKVAIEAKVPIIPVFTRNIREAFRSMNIWRSFWLWLYQKTKFPVVPIYGGFPVKLITYIGNPIPYDPSLTPELLAKKVAQTIEIMIEQHQPIPGNILRAIWERLPQKKRQ